MSVDPFQEQFAALTNVAALSVDVDDATFFDRLTETIAHLVDARRVVFGLLDGDKQLVLQPGTFGVTDGTAAMSTPCTPCTPGGSGVLEDIVYRGSSYRGGFTNDSESSPWRELLGGVDVTNALVIPWTVGADRRGIVAAFDAPAPEGFSEADARLLKIAAATAGLMWQHKVTNDHCHALNRESEALNDSIRSMVNMVVHEFRSPLTVVSGYAEMFSAGAFGDMPKTTDAPLKAIIEKTAELSGLVDALLLVAQLEAGSITAGLSHFDLRETVAAITAEAQALVGLAGASIVVVVPPSPVTAVADADHVHLILNNLIANALHYGGPHPEIRVVVANDPVPTVTVSDPGGGIPPQMHERIFERFIRGVGRTSHSGSGLGLYVSRQLAEHSGGELHLDQSTPSTGTAFSLVLRGVAANPTTANEAVSKTELLTPSR